MAARAAFSRIAPAISQARAAPSLAARRAALIRGYASQPEQHSVGLEYYISEDVILLNMVMDSPT